MLGEASTLGWSWYLTICAFDVCSLLLVQTLTTACSDERTITPASSNAAFVAWTFPWSSGLHASSMTIVVKPCSAPCMADAATHMSSTSPQQYTWVTPAAFNSDVSPVSCALQLSKNAEYESM